MRRNSRESALKMLFQFDMTGLRHNLIDGYWKENEGLPEEIEYSNLLVRGVIDHLSEIDTLIAEKAVNWSISRMGVVDRNILRIATYELIYINEIPPKVSLNEAIEIAKKYGDENSGSFINGILDGIMKKIGKEGNSL